VRDAIVLRGRLAGLEPSARVKMRPLVTTSALAAAAAVVAFASLSVGDLDVSFSQLLGALTDRGVPAAELALELRGPQVLCGLLAGIAFGIGGAIVQSVARNPLASPDVIGVSQGASLAAVIAFAIGATAQATVSLAALAGGLVAGGLVYALTWRGGIRGDRMVLVGIGLAASMAALTSFVMVRVDIDVVARVAVWLTGSLAFVDWPQVVSLAVAVAVLLPCAAVLGRAFGLIELGDDLAMALGSRLERRRRGLLIVAVAATALATSVCGPIVFAALISPQLGRLLAGTPSPTIGPAAAAGALLVVSADLIGGNLLGPRPLPVGVVTAAIGAPFMLWLLWREARL